MSSRAVKFAKLWKEQVLDKSLELAKTYKDPQSSNTFEQTTSQVKLEKPDDENLRAAFIASNVDDSKSTDTHLDEGKFNFINTFQCMNVELKHFSIIIWMSDIRYMYVCVVNSIFV